jgi:hypothetical protein
MESDPPGSQEFSVAVLGLQPVASTPAAARLASALAHSASVSVGLQAAWLPRMDSLPCPTPPIVTEATAFAEAPVAVALQAQLAGPTPPTVTRSPPSAEARVAPSPQSQPVHHQAGPTPPTVIRSPLSAEAKVAALQAGPFPGPTPQTVTDPPLLAPLASVPHQADSFPLPTPLPRKQAPTPSAAVSSRTPVAVAEGTLAVPKPPFPAAALAPQSA